MDTKYFYNDVYYLRVPEGYVVVEQPSDVAVVKEVSPVVPSKQAAGERVLVNASKLNVRSGPELHFTVVNQINQNDVLIIHGYAPEWLYVKMPDGTFGWVMLKYTSAHGDTSPG